ncbi:MAG: glutamyl-tRNA reductase [Candidatus Omnitrophota bacterium]|nr:glutamyl-tRNA reductase [Candidatus Omnitrophota bacterium]
MDLVVIGINHKTAPVEIREKFSFSARNITEANRLLKESAILEESLILSTCNRMEIYALALRDKDYVGCIKSFLGRIHNIDVSDYEDRIYIYKGKKAVEHLFGVTAGLDSMVIGEMEISGQVKNAYKDAREGKTTGKILNRLFEKALNTAKKIRTETSIGRGAVSVSSAAAMLAKKILGDLKDKTAMIVGAGAVGEQLIVYLKKNGIGSILVANRTLEKAQSLAQKFDATAVAFNDFSERLIDVEIVVASTGAPHCIIRKDDIAALMPKRKQRPLFIIDLAVPRDVESQVNTIDNSYLYDIDDLQRIVDDNISLRKNELDNCSRVIGNAADVFIGWMARENIRHEYSGK